MAVTSRPCEGGAAAFEGGADDRQAPRLAASIRMGRARGRRTARMSIGNLCTTRYLLCTSPVVPARPLVPPFVTAIVVAVCLSMPASVNGYSVLAHEAAVDAAWERTLRPVLLQKFPRTTPEALE